MKKRNWILLLLLVLIVFSGMFMYWFKSSLEHAFFIDPINVLNPHKKIVAITFDDGPSPKWTPLLLSVLKKHNVKATFFMNGHKLEKYLETAKKVFNDGHLLANHSYWHNEMIFKSKSTILADLKKTDSLLILAGELNPVLYRPPYASKLVNLPRALVELNKKLITWDINPQTEYPSANASSVTIKNEVIRRCKPGSIILLHDGWTAHDRTAMIDAVDLIIDELKAEGYKFVTIEEGLKM